MPILTQLPAHKITNEIHLGEEAFMLDSNKFKAPRQKSTQINTPQLTLTRTLSSVYFQNR